MEPAPDGRTALSDPSLKLGDRNYAIEHTRIESFEPAIVPKGERRLDGFDDRIVSLYARGTTVREIRGHVDELYGVAVYRGQTMAVLMEGLGECV